MRGVQFCLSWQVVGIDLNNPRVYDKALFSLGTSNITSC